MFKELADRLSQL